MGPCLKFLNEVSKLFDADALGGLPLLEALVGATKVIADYSRQSFDAKLRGHLVNVIRDNARPLPPTIDTSTAEEPRH